MTTQYKIVFRGDIAPGHNFMGVRKNLQELFKLDDDGLNKLFIGRAVTIKKNLDEVTALKWCNLLGKAGAKVEMIADEPEATAVEASPPAASTPAASAAGTESPSAAEYSFDVAPTGSDVLNPTERAPIVDRDVATDHLSVDVAGADVLKEHERTQFEELNLDLSHLKLADVAP